MRHRGSRGRTARESGVKIELWRKSGDLYRCTTFQIPFGVVAEKERQLPAKWIRP